MEVTTSTLLLETLFTDVVTKTQLITAIRSFHSNSIN